MNLIVVKGGAYGEPKSAYSQLRTALERFFDGEGLAEQLEHQPPDADLHRHPSRLSSSGRRLSHTLQRTVSGVSAMSDIVGEDNGERLGGYGLVIDGASLRHAFAEPYTKDLLLELSWRCRAVVCCRTSPLQKALIVRLVKDGLGSMCLAIGDGANDVSMIQAADIGVGVAGEEGLQAVNSSDYAMGQFRFLKRLLLVHGQWSYLRNSNMIVNFFYKEIIGVGVLFWFQFYCGYSATTVYEYTYLLFWNVFWTLGESCAIDLLCGLKSALVLTSDGGQFRSFSSVSSIATLASGRSWPSRSSTRLDDSASASALSASVFTCLTASIRSVRLIGCGRYNIEC